MKHRAQSIEFAWGEPEAFTLVVQQTLDGDRIARENTQRQHDQTESEKQQLCLSPDGAATSQPK